MSGEPETIVLENPFPLLTGFHEERTMVAVRDIFGVVVRFEATVEHVPDTGWDEARDRWFLTGSYL